MTLDLERELGDPVIGIDEAGRGPLAGPVFAAAVHVPLALAAQLLATTWSGVNDSKKLSARKRDVLSAIIRSTHGCLWAVASASAAEIDRLNILKATHLAMKRAHDEVAAKLINSHVDSSEPQGAAPKIWKPVLPASTLNTQPSTLNTHILVDGLPVATLPHAVSVVKGDARSPLIAAASILAKTARDAYCLTMEERYPGYGFARHKGYPTQDHLAALRKLGPCPEHRRSFGPVSQLTLF